MERELVVMLTAPGAAETVILNASEAVCTVALESETCTIKDAVPACVGVPEIWPMFTSRLRPAGRAPEEMDQRYGAVPPDTETIAV